MKKIMNPLFVTIVTFIFLGSIVQGQANRPDHSENSIGSYWNNQESSDGSEWGYRAQQQEQVETVIPYKPEYSNSEEAQALKREKEEAEKKAQEEAAKKAKECPNGCCGIKLNTNFPIIGNCIETKSNEANPTNAFPYMVGALTKFIMSLIMVVCFILVIVAGIMRAGDKPKEGKELLKKVAITILLLGFSGVILRLINPNFFG